MTSRMRTFAAFSFLFVGIAPAPAWGQAAAREEEALLDFFEKKIRPVLVDNCYNCHSANINSKGGCASMIAMA